MTDGQNRATVFAMFRDAAGNESEVIAATIVVDPDLKENIYLPSMFKQIPETAESALNDVLLHLSALSVIG